MRKAHVIILAIVRSLLYFYKIFELDDYLLRKCNIAKFGEHHLNCVLFNRSIYFFCPSYLPWFLYVRDDDDGNDMDPQVLVN